MPLEFLRGFMDGKKAKYKSKKQVHSKKDSVLVNGSGSASGGRRKGKEKETVVVVVVDETGDDDSDNGWDACDS